MKTITKWLAAVVIVLIVWLVMRRLGSAMLPPPLLLSMSLAVGKATFSVFPGYGGAMFTLPDGSLWRWGAGVTNKDRLPQMIDQQHHWVKAFGPADEWTAVESNGGLWQSISGQLNLLSSPGTEHNWADLTGGSAYALGLQSDGTMLGWEFSSAVQGQALTFTAVETNLLWRAVSSYFQWCLGVSREGKLWSWQRTGFSPLTFSPLTQESLDTNWVGVANSLYAWSSTGELWGAPVTHLYSSNAMDGRFALGPVLHEIRSDGTLWAIGAPGPPSDRMVLNLGGHNAFIGTQARRFGSLRFGSPSSSSGVTPLPQKLEWRRVGKRSDWVSVWSSYGTYFGLTSDGTVWVWGIDWGQQPKPTLKDRLIHLWEVVRDHFPDWAQGAAPFSGSPIRFLIQPYQDEPRPFMRFKPVHK
jgi:hypothetical protein